jgi:hypothetical protein
MTNYDKVYRITEAVKDRINKPFNLRKVQRGFAAAIDSLDAKIEESDLTIADLRTKAANGNLDAIQRIIDTVLEVEEMKRQVEVLRNEQAWLKADAPKDDEDKK